MDVALWRKFIGVSPCSRRSGRWNVVLDAEERNKKIAANLIAAEKSYVLRGVRVTLKVLRPQSPNRAWPVFRSNFQAYDLLAIRIIADSVKNCYGALGVIHNEWRPVPGRIKDFIAIPRPNLYQSLHTSVVGPEGKHFEAIRWL
jgi:hypothetical protein